MISFKNHPLSSATKGLVIGLCIFAVYMPAHAENGWSLIQDKDGIKIFRRSMEGTKICEFGADAIVDAPIEVVNEILGDINANKQWIEYVEDTRLVERVDEDTVILYISVDCPWPVTNRDMVLHGTGKFDAETCRVNILATGLQDPPEPRRKGYIRMTDVTSRWVLECIPHDREKTRVAYTTRSDPAGWIPAFIVNMSSVKQPYKTISALKKMARKKKYIDAAGKSDLRRKVEQVLSDKDAVEKIMDARKKDPSGGVFQ